jgi:MFS family permease
MNRWKPLIPLGAAQFLAVLDTSVMNVSISQLVADFHTTVTAIQVVITIYTLVMAAFMLTGGKVGDRIGRRRAFGIGLVVYAAGLLLTALAPTLWVLTLGAGRSSRGSVPRWCSRRWPRWSAATTPVATAPRSTASSVAWPVPASPSVRCSAGG